ncbi:MAG: hypothetical protein KC588_01295 [Nitrospira sp.]|nr:hypothetical protein [Nitrospira sp.]
MVVQRRPHILVFSSRIFQYGSWSDISHIRATVVWDEAHLRREFVARMVQSQTGMSLEAGAGLPQDAFDPIAGCVA